jgi:hypothetical protein
LFCSILMCFSLFFCFFACVDCSFETVTCRFLSLLPCFDLDSPCTLLASDFVEACSTSALFLKLTMNSPTLALSNCLTELLQVDADMSENNFRIPAEDFPKANRILLLTRFAHTSKTFEMMALCLK